jgi:hypothetical protein
VGRAHSHPQSEPKPRPSAAAGERLRAPARLVALLASACAACVSLDDIQTPNGDLNVASRGPLQPGSSGADAAAGDACSEGWAVIRFDGREQRTAWGAPSLTLSCGSAPHRLAALAPTLGASLSLSLASRTGKVLEGSYSSTRLGPDGEEWGAYEAVLDVSGFELLASSDPTQQPFAFVGTIFGPLGLVTIEASGCARVRASVC